MKRSLIVKLTAVCVVIVLTMCTLASCGSEAKEKTFENAGLSITLTDAFYEKELVSQTCYYESSSSAFVALKEDFSLFEDAGISTDMTLEEYAQLAIENNQLSSEVVKEGDLVTFSYERSSSGKDFTYFAVVKKGSDAFWLCQFFCEKKDAEKFKPQFIQWANTISVA